MCIDTVIGLNIKLIQLWNFNIKYLVENDMLEDTEDLTLLRKYEFFILEW